MSSSVLCGQAALVGLPTISRNNTMGDNSDKKKKKSQSSNGDNDNAVAAGVTFVVETPPKVEDVVVPEHLKVDKKRLKGEQNSGMEVFKLSKVRTDEWNTRVLYCVVLWRFLLLVIVFPPVLRCFLICFQDDTIH
jgi:hypothetical protein